MAGGHQKNRTDPRTRGRGVPSALGAANLRLGDSGKAENTAANPALTPDLPPFAAAPGPWKAEIGRAGLFVPRRGCAISWVRLILASRNAGRV
jgi:hypothetical protein